MNTPQPGPQIMPGQLTTAIDNRLRDGAIEFDETWAWVNFLEVGTDRWRSYPASSVVQIVWTPEPETSYDS